MEESRSERREQPRVHVRGSVILRSGDDVVNGVAVSVSATTLEVECDRGFALLATTDGAPLAIEMRLNGVAGNWFHLEGRVRRVRTANHSLVIDIVPVPAPLAAWIAAQTDRAHVPALEVMVVDSDVVRRARIAEAFRAEGCHVSETGSPLEALHGLEDASFTTRLIVVADTEPRSIGVDLRDYLDVAHVAMVVAVGDPEDSPMRARLAPSDDARPLQECVRTLLLAHAGGVARRD